MIPRLLLCGLLAGCAVDCTDTDWKQRGYRDGYDEYDRRRPDDP